MWLSSDGIIDALGLNTGCRKPFESRRHYAIRSGRGLIDFDTFVKYFMHKPKSFALFDDGFHFWYRTHLMPFIFETLEDEKRYRRWKKDHDRLEARQRLIDRMEEIDRLCGE